MQNSPELKSAALLAHKASCVTLTFAPASCFVAQLLRLLCFLRVGRSGEESRLAKRTPNKARSWQLCATSQVCSEHCFADVLVRSFQIVAATKREEIRRALLSRKTNKTRLAQELVRQKRVCAEQRTSAGVVGEV